MSLEKIISNLDLTKIKAPSGLTYSQELVRAAYLLRECIQSRINRGSMGNCISAADIADIKIEGLTLRVTLNIQNSLRPSKFYSWNKKYANVFWLLNDGYTVKKDVWFKNIPNFGYRVGEQFVEKGIKDFDSKNSLGIKINVTRPSSVII